MEDINNLTVTTVDASEPKEETTLRHSHGPNFGRFVEGCAKCESEPERYARPGQRRVKPKKIARTETGVPADTTSPGVYLTYDQLQELLMQRQADPQQDLTEALKAFARELKAPSPEEAEKKEDLAKRRMQQRARAVETAKAQEDGRLAREAACESVGHRKDEGRSTKSAIVQGQVYNDGYLRPFCQTCGKQFTPIKASMEILTSVG